MEDIKDKDTMKLWEYRLLLLLLYKRRYRGQWYSGGYAWYRGQWYESIWRVRIQWSYENTDYYYTREDTEGNDTVEDMDDTGDSDTRAYEG